MIRRIVATVASLVAALCLTPAANAAEVPGAWCSRDDASRCYTQEPSDTHAVTLDTTSNAYMYVKDVGGQRGFSVSAIGCSLVNYYGSSNRTVTSSSCTKVLGDYAFHEFRRFHKYRVTSPWIIASYTMFVGEDGVTADGSAKIGQYVQLQMNANAANCFDVDNNPVTYDVERGYRFTKDAPADFIEQCSGQVKPYLEPGAKPPTTTTDTTPKPATDTTTTCPVVAIGAKKAKVVTINLGCLVGRNTIAKYLRTGREPAGFVCVKVNVGRSRVGKCVKEGSGRLKRGTVVGTLRIR